MGDRLGTGGGDWRRRRLVTSDNVYNYVEKLWKSYTQVIYTRIFPAGLQKKKKEITNSKIAAMLAC